MSKKALKFDEVGYWSELKLDIVRDYATAYSKIISKQNLQHIYIDAFAGAGIHKSKTSGTYIAGSPTQALVVNPPFKEYHFIELDTNKVDHLKKLLGSKPNVFVYAGDCNQVLLKDIFPKAQWSDFRRALCLLDPYGLHLDWQVIQMAGKMKSIEIFLNFPIADMNRNVFWHKPDGVRESDIKRMNAFWGDDSWKDVVYTTKNDLFGYENKEVNHVIAESFRDRLKKVAGFKHVSHPLAMRNAHKAIIYYLFFASQKPVANQIVEYIFNKYSQKG